MSDISFVDVEKTFGTEASRRVCDDSGERSERIFVLRKTVTITLHKIYVLATRYEKQSTF